MNRLSLRLALLVALIGLVPLVAQSQAADSPPNLSVTVEQPEIATRLGGKFTFETTITNNGTTALTGWIANLNVVSLTDGLYVDPEDWSADRTRTLAPIPAGGSRTITWDVHAVNDGVVGMYVSVLPETEVGISPTTGPMIRLTVALKDTLNSGGILPLALGVPALIGILALGLRHRRLRQPAR